MELRRLRYFHVLARELHFRKAAEKLFIVQPALSRQVKELEAELGVVLLQRTKRSVTLTPAGAYLTEALGPLLQQVEELQQKVKLIAGGLEGEIRIGYVGSSVNTILPKILPILTKKYPGIQTYLSELPSSNQLTAIKNKDLDIGFLRNPAPDPALETILVWREPFYLVLPERHSITARNFKSLMQVFKEKFILPPSSDGELYHRHILGICEEAGFNPMVAHESTHGNTILKLVENGLGISILPLTFKKLAGKGVKFIPLKQTARKAELTAIWLKENHNGTLQKLKEIMLPMQVPPA
jgi:DNA-binding transcriptional LysR family regulator